MDGQRYGDRLSDEQMRLGPFRVARAAAVRRNSLAIVVALSISVGVAGCSIDQSNVQNQGAPAAKNSLNEGLIRCMADAGFEAEETWDGGVINSTKAAAGQMDAYSAAMDVCAEEGGLLTFALDDTQLAQLYEQELAERDCLIAKGYGVDEVPSLQTYTDTYNAGPRWTAWNFSDAADPSSFDPDFDKSQQLQKALALECPPPSWWLNLDGL